MYHLQGKKQNTGYPNHSKIDVYLLLYHFHNRVYFIRNDTRNDHDEILILGNFTEFTSADDDFDPICLRGSTGVY